MKQLFYLIPLLFALPLTAQMNVTVLMDTPHTTDETPTFSPGAGSYGSTQTVTISSTTPGATLCYTTDGSTPIGVLGSCTHGTTYTSAVSVAVSLTLKAIACEVGAQCSFVGSAAYVIGITTIVMTLDGSVHGYHANGASPYSATVVLSLGTPTAGDGIACEDYTVPSAGFTSVADNVNAGNYSVGAAAFANASVGRVGLYYKSNVAASPTTITFTYSSSTAWGYMACQAWKPASAGTFTVDSAFVQSQNGTTANPTTGTAKTPAYANELVIGLTTHASSSATAGSGFTLIDQSASTAVFPEYWIQTTATSTNAPFTAAADAWIDQMAAFYFY